MVHDDDDETRYRIGYWFCNDEISPWNYSLHITHYRDQVRAPSWFWYSNDVLHQKYYMLVMYLKRTLHGGPSQLNSVLSNSKITSDYELIWHGKPNANKPPIMDIHNSVMDIQKSIMEINISIMNILISIMNIYDPVMDIYIFVMDTHNLVMGKYGWRCNSFNMQLWLHSMPLQISITELWTVITELWIYLIVNIHNWIMDIMYIYPFIRFITELCISILLNYGYPLWSRSNYG